MQIDWTKIKSWALGNISGKEQLEVEAWGKIKPDNQKFLEDVRKYYQEEDFFFFFTLKAKKRMWRKINPDKSLKNRYKIRLYTIAASVLLCISIGGGKFFLKQNELKIIDFRKGEVQLKLANGEKYCLTSTTFTDSLPAGFQVNDTGLRQIETKEEKKVSPDNLNEITVPRCAEYQIVLADGTRVFLNAESALRFPASFGKERKVYLTGEAYFEVVSDTNRPFLVETPKAIIQVLGTQFNVRNYKGEASYTTLVSGVVRIIKNEQEYILQPGQQCEITANEKLSIHKPDLTPILAWKNGEFIFKDATLEIIMEELARWYDVQVEYEMKELRDLRFFLYIERSERPEEVMDKLKLAHKINYRIDGRKIIIKKR